MDLEAEIVTEIRIDKSCPRAQLCQFPSRHLPRLNQTSINRVNDLRNDDSDNRRTAIARPIFFIDFC
jgi:hypothetical protein